MSQRASKIPFEIYSASSESVVINPRYNSDYIEIIQVTRGCVTFSIGCEHIEAATGDVIYVPMGTMYSVVCSGDFAAVRGIRFDRKIIESNMESYESEILCAFYILSENKITLFDTSHPINPILNRCIGDAYTEYVSKDVCYMLPIRSNIYLMMSSLLRHFCSVKNDDDKSVYHNVLRLRPVLKYVDDNFYDKLYIEDLAQFIKVSADYFTKMFKESIGKTPVEYINNKRINRAMQLLVGTDDSMADIAAKIGFCNVNYFHKIFKQYMDVSPLAYRKAYSKK